MAARINYQYLLKRLVVSVFVLWITISLLFVLLKAMPGDFTTNFISPTVDPEDLQILQERYGLNDPLWVQYLKWMRNYLTLQFGYSMTSPTPVLDVIKTRLPRTLALFGTAFLFQYTVGALAGINFGWRRGTTTDQAGFVGGLTLYSIPFFWVGWILLFFFAYEGFGVALFPIGKMTTVGTANFDAVGLLLDVGYHMVLPAASLVLVGGRDAGDAHLDAGGRRRALRPDRAGEGVAAVGREVQARRAERHDSRRHAGHHRHRVHHRRCGHRGADILVAGDGTVAHPGHLLEQLPGGLRRVLHARGAGRGDAPRGGLRVHHPRPADQVR
jgi:hypothetical protein